MYYTITLEMMNNSYYWVRDSANSLAASLKTFVKYAKGIINGDSTIISIEASGPYELLIKRSDDISIIIRVACMSVDPDTVPQSTEYIDISGYVDDVRMVLMEQYIYDFAFVTETGRYITGDCRSATKLDFYQIAEKAFNTKYAYTYNLCCDDRKLAGYIRHVDGHAEDFNGVYRVRKVS